MGHALNCWQERLRGRTNGELVMASLLNGQRSVCKNEKYFSMATGTSMSILGKRADSLLRLIGCQS
jgi:hypothetical protein